MKRHQDIIDPPITVGEYLEIKAPVYIDNTDTTLDTHLATYAIQWRLLGANGALITKSTTDGGITVNVETGPPVVAAITIILTGTEAPGIINGCYKHIAEATDENGNVHGLFEGSARVVNN